MNHELINDDCMNVMARYPDKHFDLAIVDPPYGIGVNMNAGRRKNEIKKHIDKRWDNVTPNKSFFNELRRVSKNQIIWGANNFTLNINPSQGWIFWDKDISGDVEFSSGELAYTSFKRSLKKVKIRIQNNHVKEKRIHPTQKPVALYRWILDNYANQNDLILDTHAGSFSSAVACKEKGFSGVFVELDKDYFKEGKKRVDKTSRQYEIMETTKAVEQETIELFN